MCHVWTLFLICLFFRWFYGALWHQGQVSGVKPPVVGEGGGARGGGEAGQGVETEEPEDEAGEGGGAR